MLLDAVGNRFLRRVLVALSAGTSASTGARRLQPVLDAIAAKDADANRIAMRRYIDHAARARTTKAERP